MNKGLVLLAVILSLLSMGIAEAGFDCRIVYEQECSMENGAAILKLSELQAGGSHAGFSGASRFQLALCCKGVEGLSAVKTRTENAMFWLSSDDDAHLYSTRPENVNYMPGLYIKAAEIFSCSFRQECGEQETCLLSISSDNDAHVSGCNKDCSFEKKLCCSGGSIEAGWRAKQAECKKEAQPAEPEPPAETPAITLESVGLPGAGKLIEGPLFKEAFYDADNDGVANILDRCPETPAGARVLENGCRCKDTDKGIEPNKKGRIAFITSTGETGEWEDTCYSAGVLEGSCNPEFETGMSGLPFRAVKIDCSLGCREGACRHIEPGFPLACGSAEGTCFDRIRNQDEEGIDCGGKCPPCGSRCSASKYAPDDTPCTGHFVARADSPRVSDESRSDQHRVEVSWTDGGIECSCQLYEVCDPAIDYIIEEAAECCSSQSWEEADSKGALCREALELGSSGCKRCVGLYIIKGLGRHARWMRGYERNQSMDYHFCGQTVDAAPAERLLNFHKTGICRDYAGALTTLLRKAGYLQNEVGTYCDGAHCYNIVRLPGDRRWHVADTTGNAQDITLGGLPSSYPFCSRINETNVCFGGYRATPPGEPLIACSGSEDYNRDGMMPECGPGIACYRDNYALPDFAPSIKDIAGCS